MNSRESVRDFMFRGLMFESGAAIFQQAGIQIGADGAETEKALLSESLAPFNVASRNAALEMARLYAVLHCFENEIRNLIRETLSENEGVDWAEKLPPKVKAFAQSRQKSAFGDTWLEGVKTDILGFVDFGMLTTIIEEKWVWFQAIIPNQHWLKQRMSELEKTRNYIAHNRMLLPSEFQRVYMYIGDWNKVIGL